MEEEYDDFIEKKLDNYIEIKARDNLFTLFTAKNTKCQLKIPHTIVFDAGKPKIWLFNSSKDSSNKILRKKGDKLTITKIIEHFSGKRLNFDDSINNILQIKEHFKTIKNRQVRVMTL